MTRLYEGGDRDRDSGLEKSFDRSNQRAPIQTTSITLKIVKHPSTPPLDCAAELNFRGRTSTSSETFNFVRSPILFFSSFSFCLEYVIEDLYSSFEKKKDK